MLAADLLGAAGGADENDVVALGGEISPMATPVVTVPGDQSTTEGASLLFSVSTGREIRVDAPGLGAGPLRVDISAVDALGLVTPMLGFGTTAGLTVTGNGVNVFQLQGTLSNINAALASLTFYSPDNGDFTMDLVATDISTGENDGKSVDIAVANVAPLVSATFGNNAEEGHNVEVTIQAVDAGAFDNPQVSWTVSFRGSLVASGSGLNAPFLAAEDGDYELTVSAFDKDGGATSEMQFIFVQNVTPSLSLSGEMKSGVVNLSVVITDPGREVFFVQIYWTSAATTAETIMTTDRVLSFSHQYTPEELSQAGELAIAVQVSDNKANVRSTLQFREGERVAAERPEFAPPSQVTPPERTIESRSQTSGTTAQIASADLGRALTHGAPAAPGLHQFVLRVVGPDGEESDSYPIPADALADLPGFLTSLGVPDGHYRVYLITGELERLVVDGHLRAGHIVDPTDETQNGYDFPRGDVAAQQPSNPRGGTATDQKAMVSQTIADLNVASAALEAENTHSGHNAADLLPQSTAAVAANDSADVATAAATEMASSCSTSLHENDEQDSYLTMPVIGGAVLIGATSTIVCTAASSRINKNPINRLFCKRARLARKLARQEPVPAHI